MRRKKCRAAACSRKVNDETLFCRIHWQLLTPQLTSLIPDNAEPPVNARPEDTARILAGTQAAVTFLAKAEGRNQALADARRANALDPGQGGAGDADTGYRADSAARAPATRTDRIDLR
jgi:hypothetical protein